jgi:hypothetical protein
MEFDEAERISKALSIKYLTKWYDKYYVVYRRCNADDIRDKDNGYYWLQRLGVDVVGETSGAGFITIDEKIVQPRYTDGQIHKDFLLETQSCSLPGKESKGWIYTSKADLLLYCMLNKADELHCYLFNTNELKVWFLQQDIEQFGEHTEPLDNKTKSRKVPKSELKHLYEYFVVDLTAPVVISDDDSI